MALARLIASWFGTGLILRRIRGSDSGSGTVASAFTFPLAIWAGSLGAWAQVAATVIVTVAAWISIRALVEFEGDAGWIVADEAAGTFLATITLTWIPGLVALVVFRAADIFKDLFPGVAAADRAHGAPGVVGDDLVAGLYGLIAGLLAKAFLG